MHTTGTPRDASPHITRNPDMVNWLDRLGITKKDIKAVEPDGMPDNVTHIGTAYKPAPMGAMFTENGGYVE